MAECLRKLNDWAFVTLGMHEDATNNITAKPRALNIATPEARAADSL
jgi:hypothetical protein